MAEWERWSWADCAFRGNAPLCQAAKSIYYFRFGIGSALVALREKLNGLDDNLTARQMLEQLRDVLDVEDASGGRAEKWDAGTSWRSGCSLRS